ncbi:MAG: T9SS type A sorting domain-containing protein [Bacteroidales bacterium]|nr:T9SS type A sorting domain-containing protein [Candidatus Colimorpha onthohippi]
MNLLSDIMRKFLIIVVLVCAGYSLYADEPCYLRSHVDIGICRGETGYKWRNRVLTVEGTHYDTVYNVNDGCDSIYEGSFRIYANPTAMIEGDTVLCKGDSLVLTAKGGDSCIWQGGIVGTTSMSVQVSPRIPALWHNSVVYSTKYTVNVFQKHGSISCMSTASKTVYVRPTYHKDTAAVICSDSPLMFYGSLCDSTGYYEHHFQTQYGCDSVIVLNLTVNRTPQPQITGGSVYCEGDTLWLSATDGDRYVWSTGDSAATTWITTSGTYTVTAYSIQGCKADTSITLSAYPSYDLHQYDTTCENTVFWFHGRELVRAGIYRNQNQTIHGCDSSLTLHLAIQSASVGDTFIRVSDSLLWNGLWYSKRGDYSHRFVAASKLTGCDSVATLHLMVINKRPIPHIMMVEDRLLMVDHAAAYDDSLSWHGYVAYRWYCDGRIIRGENADSYHKDGYGSLSGCYYVEVATDESLSEWMPSDTLCVNVVGINETIDDDVVSVYPNPLRRGAVLAVTCQKPLGFTIYDVQGRQIFSQEVSTAVTISTERFPQGLYFLKAVTHDGQSVHRQLIIK